MKNIFCPNRMFSGNHRGKGVAWAIICCFTAISFLFLMPGNLHAAFNKYEIELITETIEESFNLLIDTWNEELYFEMYDFGQRESMKRITRTEFAQRMVELKWKPTLAPIEIHKIEIIYLNYAAIYFWQEFENKINTLNRVRKYMVFPVILENNSWKFDLTQLIRIPYEGKFDLPQPPQETREQETVDVQETQEQEPAPPPAAE